MLRGRLFTFLRWIVISLALAGRSEAQALDYDRALHLDAERLAETGIDKAYAKVLLELRRHEVQPAIVQEVIDPDAPRYAVRAFNREFVIYSPELPNDEYQSWGAATYTFFKIINDQLSNTDVRFYALNNGNDLFGIFLTLEQAEAARRSLSKRTDWPYLPDAQGPWYGQYH